MRYPVPKLHIPLGPEEPTKRGASGLRSRGVGGAVKSRQDSISTSRVPKPSASVSHSAIGNLSQSAVASRRLMARQGTVALSRPKDSSSARRYGSKPGRYPEKLPPTSVGGSDRFQLVPDALLSGLERQRSKADQQRILGFAPQDQFDVGCFSNFDNEELDHNHGATWYGSHTTSTDTFAGCVERFSIGEPEPEVWPSSSSCEQADLESFDTAVSLIRHVVASAGPKGPQQVAAFRQHLEAMNTNIPNSSELDQDASPVRRLSAENQSLRATLSSMVKHISELEGEQERFMSEGIFDVVNSVCRDTKSGEITTVSTDPDSDTLN